MDKEKIKSAVRMILEAIGDDPDREGLIDTPKRVADMYEEILQGFIKNLKMSFQYFLLKSMMKW